MIPEGKDPANFSRSPSILIVEDDGLIAAHLQEFLKKSGYCVPDPVASGEDAIECLKRIQIPDIILMDIMLDGMIDGVEAARQIRKISDIPVIFLTAHNDPKTFARAEAVAPSGFIVKPFAESEVLSLIGMILKR